MRDRSELDAMARDALVAEARVARVLRPELLTRVELVDEILRATIKEPEPRKRARGWFGIARDLLASAIERGLDLPGAAKLIRGEVDLSEPPPVSPVATVTLAEIYAAQGHVERALTMLDQVLAQEPEHDSARKARDRLLARRASAPPPATRERETNGGAASADAHDDAVVTIRLDPLRTYVYWDLRPDTLARARRRDPSGRPIVKVISLSPTPDGARRTERIVAADALEGSIIVDGFGPNTVMRACVGWETPQNFRAIAVGCELAPPVGAKAPRVLFAPRPRSKPDGTHSLRAIAHLRLAMNLK